MGRDGGTGDGSKAEVEDDEDDDNVDGVSGADC